jgi:uncharacterized protein (DUF488 family)
VEIHTIGFTQKSARRFFGAIRASGVRRLIDVRLNNVSQLAGFTKREDLAYFLGELCAADYVHEPMLAPTDDLLSAYRKNGMPWVEYERRFLDLMESRRVADRLSRDLFDRPAVLLCSEPTAAHCHRRLVAEYLDAHWGGVSIHHL